MQVHYRLTRGDMRRGISSAWRRSGRFRAFLLIAAMFPAVAYMTVRFATTGAVVARDLVTAIVITGAFGFMMPLLMIARTKTGERVLSIDPNGIRTSIGRIRGEIPWSKVAGIEATDREVLIIGRMPNFFSVPFRAFEHEQDRLDFVRAARNYWESARA